METILGILGPLAGKLLGFVVLAAGALALYLGIKRKGVIQEREKWEKETAEAKEEMRGRIDVAREKDKDIDAETTKKLEVIKSEAEKDTPPADYKPGDKFKF